MTVSIRPAATTDRAGALVLAQRLEEGVSPWRDEVRVAAAVRAWVEDSLSNHEAHEAACFVAEEHGQVVGFISVSTSGHWAGDTEAYVGELMVSPELEGRGIGRRLVDAAASWGAERGCARMSLETGASNTAAIGFYEALDFVLDEVRLSRSLANAS